MLRSSPGPRLIRRAALGLLFGTLLLAASSGSATATEKHSYGPCLANSDVAISKCLHYKLLEAKRLGGSDDRDHTLPSIVRRDGIYFYWEYGS